MKPERLLTAVAVLSAVYAAAFLDVQYRLSLTTSALEGAGIAAAIIWAQAKESPAAAFSFLGVSAIANVIVVFTWWPFAASHLLYLTPAVHAMGLPQSYDTAMAFYVHSGLAAVVYCVVVSLFFGGVYRRLAALGAALVFGMVAAIPLSAELGRWGVPAHKALWWFGLAAALLIGQNASRPRANFRMKRSG